MGSGTVESVSFTFTRDKGKAELKFIAPFVYPLGVETLIEGVAKVAESDVSKVGDIVLGFPNFYAITNLGGLLKGDYSNPKSVVFTLIAETLVEQDFL